MPLDAEKMVPTLIGREDDLRHFCRTYNLCSQEAHVFE